jgi:transaldolase/glucose-6-phosphate isomerase
LSAFPAWIEQLVAESTGKDGRGIVPVLHEPVLAPGRYGDDRLFVSIELDSEEPPDLSALVAEGHPVVRIRLEERAQLGREFYRWEVATAAAGMILGIQPFDQPDVQLAKDLARRAMHGEGDATVADAAGADLPDALRDWLARAGAGDYVSIHAYLPHDPSTRAEVAAIAASLRDATSLPVTFEFGPRFLHSTGQLHKGGANNGLFLQLVDHPEAEMAVPSTDYTFDRLIAAQSAGDAAALTQRGRRLLRIVVGEEIALADIRDAIAAAG